MTLNIVGAAPAASSATEPAPLGVQDHEVEGVEVALLQVKRNSDGTLTIRWQYRNKTNETKSLVHGYSVGLDNYRLARSVLHRAGR